MDRKEFIKICGLFGLSIPLQGMLSACGSSTIADDIVVGQFSGKVLIIGAGAAGMSAGYLLAQNGIDFEILEASSTHGGRIKRTTTFVDFPIPLGAEWIHSLDDEFGSIVNDDSVQVTTQTVRYNSQDVVGYYDGTYTTMPHGDPGVDRKFVNSTWFDFFDTYIAPRVLSNTRFNTVVTSIDYSGSQVIVTDASGQTYQADKIIFTAPLKILQEGMINFTPALPNSKQNAINSATVWGGFKAFIEFTSNFWPVYLAFPDSETSAGQRIYYDASYGQNSNRHVLGLFAVGQQAEQYQNLDSGDALKNYMLNELDPIFNGAASARYIKHISQNWNEEPFARAAYLEDNAASSISSRLFTPINNKVYFAGDSYTQEDDWSSVHVAARAARDAVRLILV